MNNRRKFIIALAQAHAQSRSALSLNSRLRAGFVSAVSARVVWRHARRMVATDGNLKMFRLTMVTTEPLAKV